MNRSWTNFAVDALIAAAFLLCALTGILFLLPPSWLSALSLGRPSLLFVSYTLWHSLHDWSGVAAATGVVAHVFLHYRWIGKMAGKLGRRRRVRRPVAERAGRQRATLPVGAAPQVMSAAAARAAERAAARQALVQRPARQVAGQPAGRETGAAVRGPGGERRFSRKAFLSGAAATIGVAALGSIGLLSRSGTTLAETQSSSTAGTQSAAGASATATQATADASSSSSATSGASSGVATTTTAARVVVDESACVGCGACLRTCPRGVFSWTNAGVAQASSPDQCILCRRCLQVCRASAITLNA